MTIKEIIEQFSTLKIEQEREVSEDYAEFVVDNNEIEQWESFFISLLGPAVKPAGKDPASDDQAVTKEFGGIYKNQTLFKKEFSGKMVIVMFWPWGNQTQTTLKIAAIGD
ncbi:MAG: hypothetical protein H6755_03820 [Candidatus Omnitrophica bacterium]|nr:hypothetical protein [Candidatus Omnitrophota bacterium]